MEYEEARYHPPTSKAPAGHVCLIGATTGRICSRWGARERSFVRSCTRVANGYHWHLHAYVVMSNHCHLAVETPLGNLSAEMHYLQSVFSNRFNKFVGERGHVFQDRYKALVLEDETALLQVVDYIHLNPVRAGLVRMEDLKVYPLSSFPVFFRGKERPKFLDSAEFLPEAGGLSDSPAGMGACHRRLKLVMEEDPAKRDTWATPTPPPGK